MTRTEDGAATRPRRWGAFAAGLLILGGVAVAVAPFMTWVEASGNGVVAARGLDGYEGWIALAAGALAVGIGAVSLRAPRRVLAALAIVAGLLGVGIGVYQSVAGRDTILDAVADERAPLYGMTPEQYRTFLDAAGDAGLYRISIGVGLDVLVGGGVLAILGGVLLAVASREGASGVGIVAASPAEADALPSFDAVVLPPPPPGPAEEP